MNSNRSKKRDYANRAKNRERHQHYDGRQRDFRHGKTSPEPFDGDKDGSDPGWRRYRMAQLDQLPERLPRDLSKRLVNVFVEGYEDVSFWRTIFDNYESDRITFEISVPPREDLAKGKKVLMGMIPHSSPNMILCVDSDFDYLFADLTEQSRIILGARYMFHTYAYATENFLCYAPSLHNVCVRVTKNDTRIFDFEKFLTEYSRIIYPLFLWYAYSARLESKNIFTLIEFKGSVKLNYLEVENNGRGTLEWLSRQVRKRLTSLEDKNPEHVSEIAVFEKQMAERGLDRDCTYLYMQGHTLMDNVVIVMLNAVCDQLKLMNNIRIMTSTKTGTALKNEQSNYNNSLRDVREILLDNEGYKESPQYKLLQRDIEDYIESII